MIDLLIMIVQSVGQILTLIVVAHSIVQMLLPADYAVRRFLERIIEPCYDRYGGLSNPTGELIFHHWHY